MAVGTLWHKTKLGLRKKEGNFGNIGQQIIKF
jgi:hypothetical protein